MESHWFLPLLWESGEKGSLEGEKNISHQDKSFLLHVLFPYALETLSRGQKALPQW